jgi:hypothetical protein
MLNDAIDITSIIYKRQDIPTPIPNHQTSKKGVSTIYLLRSTLLISNLDTPRRGGKRILLTAQSKFFLVLFAVCKELDDFMSPVAS